MAIFNSIIVVNTAIFRVMKPKADRKLLDESKVKKCEEFLKTFEDYDMEECGQIYQSYGRKKYMIEIVSFVLFQQKVANGESKVIEIAFEDLEAFFRK